MSAVKSGACLSARTFPHVASLMRATGPNSCTSSGHGTIVDFTVFIAIASATALLTPSSENGYSK
jgi:hypothetical protein